MVLSLLFRVSSLEGVDEVWKTTTNLGVGESMSVVWVQVFFELYLKCGFRKHQQCFGNWKTSKEDWWCSCSGLPMTSRFDWDFKDIAIVYASTKSSPFKTTSDVKDWQLENFSCWNFVRKLGEEYQLPALCAGLIQTDGVLLSCWMLTK